MESPAPVASVASGCLDNHPIQFLAGAFTIAKPLRKFNEDFYSIKITKSTAYFGVFDGNGGDCSARLAQEYLYPNLIIANDQGLTDENINEAFFKTNQVVIEEQQNIHSGSTGSVAFFSCDDGKMVLTVANIGDSPIVLGKENDLGLLATVLTKSHRHTDKEEQQRLANWTCEKNSSTPKRKPANAPRKVAEKKPRLTIVAKRLDFSLNHVENDMALEPISTDYEENSTPLKSLPINNHSKKQNENWAVRTGLDLTRAFGHPRLAEKGLIVKPAITKVNIIPEDKFLILMSDGVSDHIDPYAAVKLVKEKLIQNMNLNAIAQQLIIAAAQAMTKRWDENLDDLKYFINDDMTVVIVQLLH